MENKLKKGIFYVLIASCLNLVFRLITNFILPKYLSIESYAMIKSYQLYISYAGLFALGYIDGMYLELGGKKIDKFNREQIKDELAMCRTYHILLTILFSIVGIFCKNNMIILFAVSLFSTNLITYFHDLYQATGKFKSYSAVTSCTSFFTVLINFILIFFIKTDSFNIYIISYIILNTIIWIILEINTFKLVGGIKIVYFSFKEFILKVKNGILLTLGQLLSTILTGLDRWFVKILINIEAFAQYSFAVSIENFLTVAITPLTVTLYNSFCKKRDVNYVKKISEISIVFALALISVAFPIKFIIDNYLENYKNSNSVIFILFAAQIYYVLIKCIYINLYKAEKKQKKYFIKLCIIILLGIINNALLFKIHPHKEAFAYGTLICAIEWLIISIQDFKEYTLELKKYFLLGIESILFIVLGCFLDSVLGFITYFIITFLIIKIFFTDAYKYIINLIKEYIIKILSKIKKIEEI